jgi:hypothetical protein
MEEKVSIPDSELKKLSDMANRLKLLELFEEPSTYEDELEDLH